jgi:hypothetical protein
MLIIFKIINGLPIFAGLIDADRIREFVKSYCNMIVKHHNNLGEHVRISEASIKLAQDKEFYIYDMINIGYIVTYIEGKAVEISQTLYCQELEYNIMPENNPMLISELPPKVDIEKTMNYSSIKEKFGEEEFDDLPF